MKTVYLETSALLAWLFGEPYGTLVAKSIDRSGLVIASVLTLLETERALIRAETQRALGARDTQVLRGLVARARSGWMLMELSPEVLARAAQPFPVEPVRTLDAIHLATALVFLKAYPDLRVLSQDRRIVANVEALGLG